MLVFLLNGFAKLDDLFLSLIAGSAYRFMCIVNVLIVHTVKDLFYKWLFVN